MKSLEQRVEELEEEVAYLRRELGLSVEASKVGFLRSLGVTRAEARVLLVLHAAQGRTLSIFQIADAAGYSPDGIKIHISRLRVLFPEIRTDRGLGYSLPSLGHDHVSSILKAAA